MTTTINNEHKKLNVPNLRFPEFEGEWLRFTINEICSEFKSGRNIKTAFIFEDGEYPVYGGNGLRGYTSTYNHDGEYVLIGRQGALCGNIRSIKGKSYITEHAIAVSATEKNNTHFLHYLFLKMNLGQYSDQSAQPGLAVNKLLKLTVVLPELKEQMKIARLLSLLDERIATQNKVIEDLKKLKCAIIETVYNGKGHEYRIGDIIEQVSQRNKRFLVNTVLSVNNKLGFINQDEQFEDRTIASEDTSNYKVVLKDDFAYNPARINVGSIARLKSFDKGIVSPMYICFKVTDGIVPEYLESYFATNHFLKEMQKRLEGSVRLCLSFEGLCNIPIFVPCIDEQTEIGKRIYQLESKIETECNILSLYEKQKQYLLRQMFI